MNKKILIIAIILLVAGAAGGFFYMQKSKKPYLGAWKLKVAEDRLLEIELDKNTITLSSSNDDLKAIIHADYKQKEYKNEMYILETSNMEIEIEDKKDQLTAEEEKEFADELKTDLEKENDNTIQFKVSKDKKELIQVNNEGKEEEVFIKK